MIAFEYPADEEIRALLRKGKEVEDRGKIIECRKGAKVTAPADLIKGWLKRGLIE